MSDLPDRQGQPLPPDTDTSPDNPRHAEQLTLAVAIVRHCFPDAAEPSREDPMVTWVACLFEKYGRGGDQDANKRSDPARGGIGNGGRQR
jgi:hypothetical protein